MLKDSTAFGSFSTNDIDTAETFYRDTLGLDVMRWADAGMGDMLWLTLPGGGREFVYAKDDHTPASHTVLNFEVDDFDGEVAALRSKGLEPEHLEWTDEDGIAHDIESRMPATCWFKDPAGNWICMMQRVQAMHP